LHTWIVEDAMPTIKHILFPFDFSQQALRAAPFVRAIADRFEARVRYSA